jgi:hypothetical protein
MTKAENGSEIFPVDCKGRVRVSRERREQLLRSHLIKPVRWLSYLLTGCFVAPRSQIAADMFPRRASHRAKILRNPLARIHEIASNKFEKSGLSDAQFARTVGVKYQTFAFWRQERQRSKPVPAGGSSKKGATGMARS